MITDLSLTADPQAQWGLPSRLHEISALAMTPDQRLLAVDDEKAVVYEIDYVSGRLVKAFALGNPVLRGDFEGLAVVGNTVYILTSNGMLYAAPEGGDGDRVAFQEFDTGLDQQCELEGLAQDLRRARLLLLCKAVLRTADIDTVSIFPWSLETQELDYDQRIELPIRSISKRLRIRHLHPSGIAVHPDTRSLLIVAARERALIELDEDGEFLDAIILPVNERHPQAEGIEIGSAGQLFLADEGRNRRAILTVYTDSNAQEEHEQE